MSVIWNFLKERYEDIDDFIREEIPIHFLVAVAFLILWIIILGGIGLIIFFSIKDWRIGVWIVGIIFGFEFLCWFGKKLMR